MVKGLALCRFLGLHILVSHLWPLPGPLFGRPCVHVCIYVKICLQTIYSQQPVHVLLHVCMYSSVFVCLCILVCVCTNNISSLNRFVRESVQTICNG